MDDDLNTSAALAALHEVVRDGNTALTAADDVTVRTTLAATRAMLDILGVDPLDPAWTGGGRTDDLRGVVDSLIALALEQRARPRPQGLGCRRRRTRPAQAGRRGRRGHPQGPRWTIGEQD
ncbi:DALR domain-containing protein [Micromonospora sp. BRA006-A]|nr:DALR domain-containing protein [Micromonospora sp. BRA006-A]